LKHNKPNNRKRTITAGEIRDAVADVDERVIEIRHHLHRRPELGLQEQETSALIARELEALPLNVTRNIYGTGVCALLESPRSDAGTILLRADMDALPIQENTGSPFASEIPGVMHACGHDGHTAILLGTAMVLSRFRDKVPGNVKFLFQPAEETEGGAAGMIEEGVLENPRVDAAVGLHLWGSAPSGIVEYKAGPLMASPDVFSIRVVGKGGHAAMPHACVDPVPVAASIIQQLQTIVSRRVDPLDSVVISVCRVEAGTTHNVIPDEAVLEGTVRALVPEVRAAIPAMIENVARQAAAMHGAECIVDYTYRYPPLVNDEAITDLVRRSAADVLGADRVREAKRPNMGGEDFAYFAQAVPSSFFFLGIAPSETELVRHHHPEFRIDDAVLKDGIAVFCRTVFDFFDS
jgi:amidohydrolase